MRIQLAYPYEGSLPDAIVEVDNQTGRLLLREGRARVAPAQPVPDPPPKAVHKPRVQHNPTPDKPADKQEA